MKTLKPTLILLGEYKYLRLDEKYGPEIFCTIGWTEEASSVS